MPVRIRKLNIFQRFQNRKQVCFICNKAPADHWSYLINNKGQFISEPKPKYFHLKCYTNQMDESLEKSRRELELLVAKRKDNGS